MSTADNQNRPTSPSDPDSQKSNGGHIRLLTSLRLFAALAVLLYHYFNLGIYHESEVTSHRPIQWFLQQIAPSLRWGNLGVDFFFVLSGFVLCHVYYRSFLEKRFNYFGFLRKRVARLYPIHFVMLLIFIGVGAALFFVGETSSLFTWRTVPYHLLLVHAWGFQNAGTFNNVSWSISAEWAAYLLFPVFLYCLTRVKPATSLVISLIWFAAFAYFLPRHGEDFFRRTYDFGVLRILAEFPIGISLWLVYRQLSLLNLRHRFGITLMLVGLIAGLACSTINWNPAILVCCFSALILGGALSDGHWSAGVLESEMLVYGGEISYSIYMVHVFIQRLGEHTLALVHMEENGLWIDLTMVGCLALSLVAAHFSYIYIERPGRVLISGVKR